MLADLPNNGAVRRLAHICVPSPSSTKEVSATLAEYLPATTNMKLNFKPLLVVPFHVVRQFRSRIDGELQRTTVIFLQPLCHNQEIGTYRARNAHDVC